jgi:hypothetical protein
MFLVVSMASEAPPKQTHEPTPVNEEEHDSYMSYRAMIRRNVIFQMLTTFGMMVPVLSQQELMFPECHQDQGIWDITLGSQDFWHSLHIDSLTGRPDLEVPGHEGTADQLIRVEQAAIFRDGLRSPLSCIRLFMVESPLYDKHLIDLICQYI